MTKNNTRKPLYAAIPLPAIQDQDLAASHLRVLAVIAYHARFGRNGNGCYLQQSRIAKLAGIHANNMPAIIRDLAELGYIEIAPPQGDRRRHQYFVAYTTNEADDPWHYFDTTSNDEVLPDEETTRTDEVLSEETTSSDGVFSPETTSNDEVHLKRCSETKGKRDSAKAASPGGDGEIDSTEAASRDRDAAWDAAMENGRGFICRLDRETNERIPNAYELEVLTAIADGDLGDELETCGHALRVLEEIVDRWDLDPSEKDYGLSAVAA